MKESITIGKSIPNFKMTTTDPGLTDFTQLKGHTVVLYFYPKDDTPGCTLEAQDFRNNIDKFQKLNCTILGVSRDNLACHDKFKEKHELPFALISDDNENLCNLFDVIRMKNLYGKEVRGIERSTFLINRDGTLAKIWRPVKVDGHVEEILQAVKAL